jgi:FAD/FMN-containing dehydrogenase
MTWTSATFASTATPSPACWPRNYYAAIHPHSGSAGGYINFMSGDDHHRAADNYGANYERLSAVKAVYDPDNLFHVNQNIAPAKPRCAR